MNRYVLTLLLSCLSTIFSNSAAFEKMHGVDDDLEFKQIINAHPVIYLDEESQKLSGLETDKLRQVNYRPEFIAYGKAISLSPLLAIRNQYMAAIAQQAGAQARLSVADKNITRLRNLHKNEAISTRTLQKQQTQWQSDKADYRVRSYQSQIIINNSQLQWGNTVTQWLISKSSDQFEKLIRGELLLIKITLPPDRPLPPQVDTIFIDPAANRSSAFKASLLDILPQVDNFSQGLQYIFLTKSSAIKTGMNVTAWIPQDKLNQSGVIIPESSITWHLGQANVFIKIGQEQFVHRNINHPVKVTDGYFIHEQIIDGEEIVTTGAQILLSHEFRSQIPDEDDD